MLHQSSTVIIGAGFCWLFLLLGWVTVFGKAVDKTALPNTVTVTEASLDPSCVRGTLAKLTGVVQHS
jgi:hypothetical protein